VPDLSYFSPKVEKRSSPIDGRGLFATTAVAKDEIVVVKGGYVFTREQRDRIGQDLGPSEIQITETLFIGPTTPAEREGGMMPPQPLMRAESRIAGPDRFRRDARHRRW